MKDAGLTAEQIDEAVLVGGSTRIPLVRKLVEEHFQRTPHADLNPDEVVALGAAVQANILAGGSEATKEMLLLDVTPLSLGIEVARRRRGARSFIATRPFRRRPPSTSLPASKARPTSPSTWCRASANWRKTAARWRAST